MYYLVDAMDILGFNSVLEYTTKNRRLKPNYFKKQCSLSSFLFTYGNNTGPNWPGVLSRLVPCI